MLGISELELSTVPAQGPGTEAPAVPNRRSIFMELLHLQHYTECMEYNESVIRCICTVYDVYAADQAQVKEMARADEASHNPPSTRGSKVVGSSRSGFGGLGLLGAADSLIPPPPEVPSIPLGLVRQAVIRSDSNKTRGEVNQLLSYCCKLSIEESLLLEARKTPFPIEEIKSRIRMKIMKKSPPIT